MNDKDMVRKGMAPVSAVIPCFRCSATIGRAVTSIAKQTLRPAEVILVDDASGDGTADVLNAIRDEYQDWVHVVELPSNRGAGGARNAGWAAATQPYIAFLDADDAWHPQKIEIQYAYMNAHPEVELCGHGHRIVQRKDELPGWRVSQCEVRPIHKWYLLLSNRFTTPSAMVRRDVGPRFVEGQRYMEDHMLWLLLICSGGRVVKLSAELAAIYKRPFGVTGLSAQVWLMGRGDLGNYLRLWRTGCINGVQLFMLGIYSALKHLRRLLIYWGYLRWKE